MKIVILLAFVTVVSSRPDSDVFGGRFENFNVQELIENQRLLKSYVLCYLDKGKCTPEGNDFKKAIPESVHSKCERCTEKQKPLIAAVLRAILEKFPNDWEELLNKYDPTGEHREEFKEFIKQYAPSEK